ncbi:alpha/beta fold hydrolase [Bradyrhizobium centrolobii]|uniref:alpha/beta fold hydrolase n=1 Tax=Bradyrhizobium centrolobii TaxID=1505087 RepID=UPI00191BC0DA|nr:alpha/beta fold hydrolase [Bradyrhizobium centrolobii]
MKSLWLRTTQANLLYHDIAGQGVPLIFIHGLGCASSCDYPAVAADPALAGRRILLVDLLGSGFSDRPAAFGYAVADHASALADFVMQVAPEAVDLFGHSMGGSVAIMAAKLLGQRVRNLVLSEPNLDPGGGMFSRKITTMSEADYVALGHEALIKASIRDGNVAWAASLSLSAPVGVHRGAQSLVTGTDPTWRRLLLGLAMPRTVVFGEFSLPQSPDAGLLPHRA